MLETRDPIYQHHAMFAKHYSVKGHACEGDSTCRRVGLLLVLVVLVLYVHSIGAVGLRRGGEEVPDKGDIKEEEGRTYAEPVDLSRVGEEEALNLSPLEVTVEMGGSGWRLVRVA